MRAKIVVITLILVLSIVFGSNFALAMPNYAIDAEIGLLYDFDSGQVLAAQNADQPWIPASLVKVMTMYVALDQIRLGNASLDTVVTVSERAWRMGGSQMFLEVGEKVTIEDLLYGIAVVSGNDASVALAEALAGREEVFVQWMNAKAKDLGLNLHFTDVHGLSEVNQIVALDYAILTANYLKDYPEALKYHKEKSFSYKPRSSKVPIVQNNRNGLLWSYEGADGLKTGHLSKAGYNFVATATRDGRRLIAVVLGADSERKREQVATNLLNYGFNNFTTIEVASLMEQTEARVFKGKEKMVGLALREKVVTIAKDSAATLETKVELKELVAPIKAGEQVGELVVYQDGQVLKRTPLLASEEVPRGGWFRVLIDTVILFFSKLITK